MTEAEWLAATDPTPMLDFLRGKVSDRKSRLYACGCVATVSGMPWEVGKAVEYVEKHTDGLLTWEDVVSRFNRKAFQCGTITVGTNVYQFEFPPLLAPAQEVAELTIAYCSRIRTYHM